MTKAQLAEAIDRLGTLRDQLHVLKGTEKALAEALRIVLKAIRGKAGEGKKYRAELIRADRVVIENLAALRRAAGRKFFDCIRADVAAIRRVLGGAAVARLGKTERGWQLRIYSREPAKAPRKAPERKRR